MTTNITPERLAALKELRAARFEKWKIWDTPEFRQWCDPQLHRRMGQIVAPDSNPEFLGPIDRFLEWAELQVTGNEAYPDVRLAPTNEEDNMPLNYTLSPSRTDRQDDGIPAEEIDYKAKWDALWEDLHQEAKDRDFCEEYDALVEKHGGPKRPKRVELTATLRFPKEFPADIDLSRGVPDANTFGERRTILMDHLLKGLEEGGTYDYERIRLTLRQALAVDSIEASSPSAF